MKMLMGVGINEESVRELLAKIEGFEQYVKEQASKIEEQVLQEGEVLQKGSDLKGKVENLKANVGGFIQNIRDQFDKAETKAKGLQVLQNDNKADLSKEVEERIKLLLPYAPPPLIVEPSQYHLQ